MFDLRITTCFKDDHLYSNTSQGERGIRRQKEKDTRTDYKPLYAGAGGAVATFLTFAVTELSTLTTITGWSI